MIQFDGMDFQLQSRKKKKSGKMFHCNWGQPMQACVVWSRKPKQDHRM